ncbi:MAG: DUF5615 family PIN-like protein [Acidobacteriota bacterium]|jgi:predicted nuclease of predicted toxin-antitoxin system
MRFLADESCDAAVARALRAAGHDVVEVREVCPGADDEAVVQLAVRESRTLLTEDKDFGQLFFASASQSPGVVLIRFPASGRQAMVQAVLALVARAGHELGGRFAVVQPGRIRITDR